MTKRFLDKIIRLGSVDTSKYRYVCKEYPEKRIVKRIKIEYLGTNKAYDDNNWEVVYVDA